MVQVNRIGVFSAIAGLALLLLTWYFSFYGAGSVPLVASLVAMAFNGVIVGGLVWLGLFLLVLGVLIILI